METEKYVELLLLIELAENCHRDILIEQAKHQADADRAARRARASELKIKRFQRQLEEMSSWEVIE
jgi:hypothetical protein